MNPTQKPAIGRSELALTALFSFNIFLLLVAYYVLKTVREPMVLASGSAELKSYAAAGQAIVLLGLVPAYAWLARHVGRRILITTLTTAFAIALQVFYPFAVRAVPQADAIELAEGVAEGVAEQAQASLVARGADPEATPEGAEPPEAVELADFFSLGYAFFVFVGLFSVTLIAQAWSLINDLFSARTGERLLPFIVVGANVGGATGAFFTARLFEWGVAPAAMLQVCCALVVLHGAISFGVAGLATGNRTGDTPLEGPNGFRLVAQSRYLLVIAGVIVLLNLVNTTGEYILSSQVKTQATALLEAGVIENKGAWIGQFYGDFFARVNLATLLVQLIVVPIAVRRLGIAAVVFALPVVALGTYGLVVAGAGFAAFQVAKMAENTTDYSVMNSARALLWGPTSADEKYKARQAVDTFVVRAGDVVSAALVAFGTGALELGPRGFALVNVVVTLAWLWLASRAVARYGTLTGPGT